MRQIGGVKAILAALLIVGAAQEIYVCPMHPDVTSTSPGTCPKCGMKLVLKK